MKKDLAVRIGAILMVLMVAFLSILPDLVNAEGDDPEPSTEIVAQAPSGDEAEIVAPEIPEGEETPEITEPAEPEIPDEPGTETPADPEDPAETTETPEDTLPQEPAETETPDTEAPEPVEGDQTPSETPDVPTVENPPADPVVEDPAGVQNPTVETPSSETVQPIETPAEVPENPEETILDVFRAERTFDKEFSTRTVTPLDILDEMYSVNTDEEDFIMEGTTVTGYKGPGGYIAIPEKATAIGDNAFFNNTSITGVLFSQNLRSIGSSAFNGCSNLESVNIPSNVTIVGPSAFANCTGLSGIGIGVSTGSVSQGEFYNCKSLASVSVPEGITSIASGAFADCSNLSSVSLPSTLTSLDTAAFSGDVNLTSISAAGGSYASYDGCVYSGDGRQLLLCPQGKTGIAFSPQTTSITSGAFSGCAYLLSVEIPGSVTSIAADVFSGSAVQSVTIPASVTSIGTQSGWQPSVIYGYRGTAAENWANANNYVFESIDGTPAPNTNSTEEPLEAIEDEDPTNNNDNKKPNGQSGNGNSPVYGSSPAGATGTSATISRNANGRVNSTPKTGVEDYRMYFLFGAIFLIGIALFAYSRKLRIDANDK